MPAKLALDPMYQKYCESAGGMPIVAFASVSDEALVEASKLVVRLLGRRPHLRDGIIAHGGYVVILDQLQQPQDLPEHRDLPGDPTRWGPIRGLGPGLESPLTVGSEEDVMCWDRGQQQEGEQHSTLLHELGHTIHLLGLADTTRPGRAEPFAEELRSVYEQAMQAGRWRGTYAATNEGEYWAEGVALYFGGPDNVVASGVTVGVRARRDLATYDPPLFELLHWAFGDDDWTPRCPAPLLTPPPTPGRSCDEVPSGPEVIHFTGGAGAGSATLSGTVSLSAALEGEHSVAFFFDGFWTVGWAPVPAGARAFRYVIEHVRPGNYLLAVYVDADGDDAFVPGFDWSGGYDPHPGLGSAVVRVEPGRFCGADIAVRVDDPFPPDARVAAAGSPRN